MGESVYPKWIIPTRTRLERVFLCPQSTGAPLVVGFLLVKNMTKHLLTEREVEHCYGLSVHWLRKKRSKGGGPPYLKLPGVRYQRQKIDNWLAQQEHRN
jgi:predicted DNA-binding transcriptional regulator AlpA